jgi:hypothetical protein
MRSGASVCQLLAVRSVPVLARMMRVFKGKDFFFEKKKQKTFATGLGLSG